MFPTSPIFRQSLCKLRLISSVLRVSSRKSFNVPSSWGNTPTNQHRQIARVSRLFCTNTPTPTGNSKDNVSTPDGGYCIYDCDVGNDDAWGLMMLIRAEKFLNTIAQSSSSSKKSCGKSGNGNGKEGPTIRQPYKLLGVTCVQGNTDVDNGVKNTLRVLEAVDRLDLPVYRGCADQLIYRSWTREKYYHGKDGFGDVPNLPECTSTQAQPEHAIDMMYASVCKYPNMVDFLLVGPLTNFAMCINRYGCDFLDKVRSVWIMGGNVRAKGNVTRCAEFNFSMDPEAAYTVLASVKQPTTILPWESCVDGEMNIKMDWRFNELAKVDSKAMKLMNVVEKAIFESKGFDTWLVCDAGLVTAYLFPDPAIKSTHSYHATVELDGTHTRGQMVLDHLKENKENVCVIMDLHEKHYKNAMAWTGGLLKDDDFRKALNY